LLIANGGLTKDRRGLAYNQANVPTSSKARIENAIPQNHWLRTPKSSDTSSDEVFQLANSWISKCNSGCDCAGSLTASKQQWYPKRLIDLKQIKYANGLQEIDSLTFFSKSWNLERVKVTLVEPATLDMNHMENNLYVTLSHCWGKPESAQGQLKLTTRTEARFKTDGIELRELSKTFRETMLFASRLENVGYVWIDSLCIMQRLSDPRADQKDAEKDWLEQSSVMHKVYREAYLNISATAATDGEMGLFFHRRPEELWEDEINLNVTGLLGPDETNNSSSLTPPVILEEHPNRDAPAYYQSSRSRSKRLYKPMDDVEPPRKLRRKPAESPFDLPRIEEQTGADCLERCIIINVAIWDDLVEQAPVNQRAWVLQERLMAPRVLHFCRNQVAWECTGFQDAEGHPEGLPLLTTRLGDIVEEGRLKCLTEEVGLRLRRMRLNDFEDPDKDMENLHVYELWKRVTEVYSRMSLTMSRDKLIALSGIAKHFHQWTRCDYYAGLWKNHLESQLLWHVNEVFKDGEFNNDSRRDPSRAPSFSWASLDSPNGITYGEATDYKSDPDDLLFKVKSCRLWHTDEENPFGMIENGKGNIVLTPKYLHRIKLRKLQPPQALPCCWSLADGPQDEPHIEYHNLYLDAPVTDLDVFAKDSTLYCMPAAYGERTVKRSSRYLICLLLILQRKERGRMYFKRFGLAKLSSYTDNKGQKALKSKEFQGKDIVIE
jgi:Heterokaryon incompatibility protein (HET)